MDGSAFFLFSFLFFSFPALCLTILASSPAIFKNGDADKLYVACDWFGTAGNVQLIPQFERYWEGGDVDGLKPDGVLPSNCEAVELVREDICCE